jgi:hypothetical protein
VKNIFGNQNLKVGELSWSFPSQSIEDFMFVCLFYVFACTCIWARENNGLFVCDYRMRSFMIY